MADVDAVEPILSRLNTASEICGAMFEVVDVDGSGVLESDEGKMYLSATGCSPEQLDYYWEDLLRVADTDNDGSVDKDEFLRWVLGEEDLEDDGTYSEEGRKEELHEQLYNLASTVYISQDPMNIVWTSKTGNFDSDGAAWPLDTLISALGGEGDGPDAKAVLKADGSDVVRSLGDFTSVVEDCSSELEACKAELFKDGWIPTRPLEWLNLPSLQPEIAAVPAPRREEISMESTMYKCVNPSAQTKEFMPPVTTTGGATPRGSYVIHQYKAGDTVTISETRQMEGGRYRAHVTEPVEGWVSFVATDGTKLFEAMSPQEVNDHRRKKASWGLWC